MPSDLIRGSDDDISFLLSFHGLTGESSVKNNITMVLPNVYYMIRWLFR